MLMQKENTPQMFDAIAQTYDKLNHRLSLNLDKVWRRKFVKFVSDRNYDVVLDVASGTGDLLLELQKLKSQKYIALDPSKKMLEIAKALLLKELNLAPDVRDVIHTDSEIREIFNIQ